MRFSCFRRWPGASIIVIKGHKHLKECAYIGDNSSEELDELESSEEGNGTHILKFMRKLTTGMTVPDMAPDVVYLAHNPNDKNVNNKYFKKSSKTANHHLDYAEDLYQKELQEQIENEDYITKSKKSKPNANGKIMDDMQKSKEFIEESLRRLGNHGEDGATLLRKLKEVLRNDLNASANNTAESANRLYEIIENAMSDDDTSWRSPRLRHYRSRFKRSVTNDKEERENLGKELFKHDQQNDAAVEEVR